MGPQAHHDVCELGPVSFKAGSEGPVASDHNPQPGTANSLICRTAAGGKHPWPSACSARTSIAVGWVSASSGWNSYWWVKPRAEMQDLHHHRTGPCVAQHPPCTPRWTWKWMACHEMCSSSPRACARESGIGIGSCYHWEFPGTWQRLLWQGWCTLALPFPDGHDRIAANVPQIPLICSRCLHLSWVMVWSHASMKQQQPWWWNRLPWNWKIMPVSGWQLSTGMGPVTPRVHYQCETGPPALSRPFCRPAIGGRPYCAWGWNL